MERVRHNGVASWNRALFVLGRMALNRFNACWYAIQPVNGPR